MSLDVPATQCEALASRIHALVAEGRRSLTDPDVDQWKSLALTRFQLLRALGDFIAFKEEQVLVPILCRADAATAVRAKAMKARNHCLQDEYDAFVAKWAMTNPLSVDRSYRAEASEMARRIEHQIAADMRAIKELAAEAQRSSSIHPG